jgi:hypothetical protein
MKNTVADLWELLPKRSLGYLAIALLFFGPAHGQTPSDALMMPTGDICILFNHDVGSFDRYWEGSDLRHNETIATVHRNTTLPMAAIGVLNSLNFYVGVPYVHTKSSNPNGGRFEGADGFQDLILALKYRALEKTVGPGELSLFSTAGFSTPITNYLSDYQPYSLGLGAPEFSLRGIVQYRMHNGLYARAGAAHLWRGYTEAERDYYYDDGSYYTAWMDVPNAWNYDAALGLWLAENALKLEVNYTGLKSTSGDDIRAYNAAQPTNKVKFDKIGFSVQYYFPSIKGLGVLAYHSRIFNGTNSPKMNNTGAGLTYQFNFKKKTDEINKDNE